MNEMQAFAPGALSFGAISSHSLSQPLSAAASTTPDGSKFFTNPDGEIIYVQYASGAIMSKQANHVLVRTAYGDNLLGSLSGLWCRID